MPKVPIPSEFQGWRVVTAEEMREIDRRTILEFGVTALELMERAGRGVADEAKRWLESRLGPRAGKIGVCCGRGNNGGDGLVAARLLKEEGSEVSAWLLPAKGGYGPEVQANLERARRAGVPVEVLAEDGVPDAAALASRDLLLDALLGTGSSGKPAGQVRRVIQAMMKSGRPILAVDLPSGLHPDTGYHSGVFITAVVTATLGLPKRGLLATHAQRNVGELKVVDLDLPKALILGVKR